MRTKKAKKGGDKRRHLLNLSLHIRGKETAVEKRRDPK